MCEMESKAQAAVDMLQRQAGRAGDRGAPSGRAGDPVTAAAPDTSLASSDEASSDGDEDDDLENQNLMQRWQQLRKQRRKAARQLQKQLSQNQPELGVAGQLPAKPGDPQHSLLAAAAPLGQAQNTADVQGMHSTHDGSMAGEESGPGEEGQDAEVGGEEQAEGVEVVMIESSCEHEDGDEMGLDEGGAGGQEEEAAGGEVEEVTGEGQQAGGSSQLPQPPLQVQSAAGSDWPPACFLAGVLPGTAALVGTVENVSAPAFV